jgi:CubicO group peptidase (beta-lactamase class C family)
MILVQQKRIDLDAPLSRFLPEWSSAAKNDPDPAWRARVTPRMLLLHDSGLPAHRDFYKEARGHDAILSRVFAEPLVHEPGKQIEYSDLGFILLGEIVERLTGESLAVFAQKEIFPPLGMKDSLFNPPRSLRAQIPPTENDLSYRKHLIQGEVHDQNAWAMGGIAGDAGLFSTAGDVAIFAQMILNGGICASSRGVTRDDRQFTAHQTIGDSRTLGWDVPLDRLPRAAFSRHTLWPYGFWAPLWIDPDESFIIC